MLQLIGPRKNALGYDIPVAVLDMFLHDEAAQLRESIDELVKKSNPVMDEEVPGDTRTCRNAADNSRKLTKALIGWVALLHKYGFATDGKLQSEDFGISHCGVLKGTHNLLDSLIPANDTNKSKDMDAVADVIEHKVFVTGTFGALPADFANLVLELRSFNSTLYDLVQRHVALELGTRKLSLFTVMYDRLMILKVLNNAMYGRILQAIPLTNWLHNAMKNIHLHEILRFRGSTGTSLMPRIAAFLKNSIGYAPTREDELRFWRNGGAHLIKDYSLDVGGLGLQEALKAATAAAVTKVQSLAVALSTSQPVPSSNAKELQALVPPSIAWHVANSISSALGVHNGSPDVAGAAALAAALSRVNDPSPVSLAAANRAAAAAATAAAAASASASTAAASVSQGPGLVMFDEKEVADMFYLVDANMLSIFQKAMFVEGQLSKLEWHEDGVQFDP